MLTEATVVDSGFTLGELRAAFDAVCNKDNWKGPINAEIAIEKIRVTLCAVRWFAGHLPEIRDAGKPGMVRVLGVGYYVAVGA